jgi:hypothetical protein
MGKAFDRVSSDRSVSSFKLGPCKRCDHSPDWHRLDDSLNVGPCDPGSKFRCIGYDCEKDGQYDPGACDCPDYVDNVQDVRRNR